MVLQRNNKKSEIPGSNLSRNTKLTSVYDIIKPVFKESINKTRSPVFAFLYIYPCAVWCSNNECFKTWSYLWINSYKYF